MLRIVIVEDEEIAKAVIFALRKVLQLEFSFTHYTKIIDFIKANDFAYDMIILDEGFNNVRVHSALCYTNTKAIFMYLCETQYLYDNQPHGRYFWVDKQNTSQDMEGLKNILRKRLQQHDVYALSYNGVSMQLKYYDIYYVEKEGKNLIYHTKKGNFYERASIGKKVKNFIAADFIQIHRSILVNFEYVFKVDEDYVELHNHEKLPLARSRKKHLTERIRANIKA
ncbi:MAG: LytTR family DNA-binding domain-containing protein [Breznakia sp.]